MYPNCKDDEVGDVVDVPTPAVESIVAGLDVDFGLIAAPPRRAGLPDFMMNYHHLPTTHKGDTNPNRSYFILSQPPLFNSSVETGKGQGFVRTCTNTNVRID